MNNSLVNKRFRLHFYKHLCSKADMHAKKQYHNLDKLIKQTKKIVWNIFFASKCSKAAISGEGPRMFKFCHISASNKLNFVTFQHPIKS
jgi:hypothetical protein